MNIIKYDIKKVGGSQKVKYTEVWGVPSDSNKEKIHIVCLNQKGVWSCGCPHWTRNVPRPECKHIKRVIGFKQKGFVDLYDERPLTKDVEEKLNRFSAAEV